MKGQKKIAISSVKLSDKGQMLETSSLPDPLAVVSTLFRGNRVSLLTKNQPVAEYK